MKKLILTALAVSLIFLCACGGTYSSDDGSQDIDMSVLTEQTLLLHATTLLDSQAAPYIAAALSASPLKVDEKKLEADPEIYVDYAPFVSDLEIKTVAEFKTFAQSIFAAPLAESKFYGAAFEGESPLYKEISIPGAGQALCVKIDAARELAPDSFMFDTMKNIVISGNRGEFTIEAFAGGEYFANYSVVIEYTGNAWLITKYEII